MTKDIILYVEALKLSDVPFLEGPGLVYIQEICNDSGSVHFHIDALIPLRLSSAGVQRLSLHWQCDFQLQYYCLQILIEYCQSN